MTGVSRERHQHSRGRLIGCRAAEAHRLIDPQTVIIDPRFYGTIDQVRTHRDTGRGRAPAQLGRVEKIDLPLNLITGQHDWVVFVPDMPVHRLGRHTQLGTEPAHVQTIHTPRV
jgi:hypothetical protein